MELRVEDCLGCPSNILSYLSLVCTRLVWALPLSASDPHISPPTGGRWQHVKRVSAVGLMYSTLKLKCWGISASTTRQSRRQPFPDLCLGLPEIRKKRAGMKTVLFFRAEVNLQHSGSVCFIKCNCFSVLPLGDSLHCKCCTFK